ncbi:MAG TPA: hypothetical protein VIV60_09155 [Polyangiaceae bacterium]
MNPIWSRYGGIAFGLSLGVRGCGHDAPREQRELTANESSALSIGTNPSRSTEPARAQQVLEQLRTLANASSVPSSKGAKRAIKVQRRYRIDRQVTGCNQFTSSRIRPVT